MTIAIDIAVELEAWNGLGDVEACVERAVAAALDVASVIASEAKQPRALKGNTGDIATGRPWVASPLARNDENGLEVSVVLADDAFVRHLNARWRGKDAPTNVLSFPAAAPPMLGDIVVAYETSARESEAAGLPLADYLSHLVVHGVFHLVGHDHEDEAEADEMERLESLALARLGIASPYAVAAS